MYDACILGSPVGSFCRQFISSLIFFATPAPPPRLSVPRFSSRSILAGFLPLSHDAAASRRPPARRLNRSRNGVIDLQTTPIGARDAMLVICDSRILATRSAPPFNVDALLNQTCA